MNVIFCCFIIGINISEIRAMSNLLHIHELKQYLTGQALTNHRNQDHDLWLKEVSQDEGCVILDHPLKGKADLYAKNPNDTAFIDAFNKMYDSQIPAKKRDALVFNLTGEFNNIPFYSSFYYKPFLITLKDKPEYNKYSCALHVAVPNKDHFEHVSKIKTAVRKHIKAIIEKAFKNQSHEQDFIIADDSHADWIYSDFLTKK